MFILSKYNFINNADFKSDFFNYFLEKKLKIEPCLVPDFAGGEIFFVFLPALTGSTLSTGALGEAATTAAEVEAVTTTSSSSEQMYSSISLFVTVRCVIKIN